MSNRGKIKPPLRNFQVLMARAAAEVKPGGNIAHVQHDDWSPTLVSQSMLDCVCRPVIQVEHVVGAKVPDGVTKADVQTILSRAFAERDSISRALVDKC